MEADLAYRHRQRKLVPLRACKRKRARSTTMTEFAWLIGFHACVRHQWLLCSGGVKVACAFCGGPLSRSCTILVQYPILFQLISTTNAVWRSCVRFRFAKLLTLSACNSKVRRRFTRFRSILCQLTCCSRLPFVPHCIVIFYYFFIATEKVQSELVSRRCADATESPKLHLYEMNSKTWTLCFV